MKTGSLSTACCPCLDLWCITEVTMEADMGPSTQALPSEERRRRFHKTLVGVPPKQPHQPNELVENAVRRLESLIRTYEAELEARLSKRNGASALILPVLVRHGAFVLTRFIVEADGRSSCARLRGREYTSALAAIGETVNPSWAAGVLGRRDESVEIIMGTPRGVVFRRSVPESKWSRQEYNKFLGVPWNPRGLHVEAQVASGRTRHKTKMIVAKRGPTPGCPACVGASSTHSRVGVRSSRRSSVAPATVH